MTSRVIPWAVALALSVGCAKVTVHQVEIAADGTRRETTFRGITFWDAKSEMARAQTTMTEKSQSVNVSGLKNESSGSNAVVMAERMIEAVARGAVKGAVPGP